MEEALLVGEGSGCGGAVRKTSNRRRLDAIAFGTPYQKAAALVDLAGHGIGFPEEILDQSNLETAAKLYFTFIRFDFVWTLNYFALIALNFFEQPLWCHSISENSCSNRDYYFLGALPYLTHPETLVYEGVTLTILLVHTLFPISYEGLHRYWRNHINKLKVISLLIMAADLVVDVLHLSPVAIYSLPMKIAPYLRVVFFILSIRDLQGSLLILAGMLNTYINVLALTFPFLLFSSWLAYVIFENTEQGVTTFNSYSATLYQMFVLFTTSNNPDVWIPAYKSSRWSSLFFILYVLLGVYFVTNLILAVVYDSFKTQLAKQVSEKDRVRTRILLKAFSLMDKHVLGYLNKDQRYQLFQELNKYGTLPKISNEDFAVIFDELDASSDFRIDSEEFTGVINAITLKFQKTYELPWLAKFPFYYSSFSTTVKAFVRHSKFKFVIGFVLLLNLAAVAIETTLDITNNSGQKFWQKVEFAFGWLFVLEMALKVYSYGFTNYWTDNQNRFDFIITWVIVIGETATFLPLKGLTFISSGESIRYLLIARMLRLVRLLMHVERYRTLIATFLTLIPSLMPYLGTIFCVLCIYCSIGIQIFGGLVNAGNPDLPNTDLANNEYPASVVIMALYGYAELTGTAWSYVYFISFYLITVLLLLNLIVAFVLEAFFAELELASLKNSEDEEERLWRPRGVVGTNSRSQRVHTILHHILRSELSQSSPVTG